MEEEASLQEQLDPASIVEPVSAEEHDAETAAAGQQYRLPGDPPFFQVEPEASYWARCEVLRIVSRFDVKAKLTDANGYSLVKPYPSRNSTQAQKELQEIRDRFAIANDPTAFDKEYRNGQNPAEWKLSRFLNDERFLKGAPAGAGAVLNRRRDKVELPGLPIIRTGAELATLFEAETPGLWHRHVLNVILDSPAQEGFERPLLREVLSPPRQALIWHALETANASALMAIWHYKWLATGLPQVAFRERPWEADNNLQVLFDYKVRYDDQGNIVRDQRRPDTDKPQPSPGTPRHPAYGSGHSTYSAAISYVLSCLAWSLLRPLVIGSFAVRYCHRTFVLPSSCSPLLAFLLRLGDSPDFAGRYFQFYSLVGNLAGEL